MLAILDYVTGGLLAQPLTRLTEHFFTGADGEQDIVLGTKAVREAGSLSPALRLATI